MQEVRPARARRQKVRRCGRAIVIALLAAAIIAPVTPTQASSVPSLQHVFVIVMENTAYSSIVGNSSAPYINGLIAQGGLATNYYAATHPSLPNYLALTGGSTFGISSDCTTCWVNASNIGDRLESAGKSWKAYEESMPSTCYVGDSYPYMQKHNPFVYFNDIRNNPSRCSAHDVPYSQLATDLQSASTTPSYAFITPNMCDDMHDCSISSGDSWLSQQVPAILGSPAFTTQRSVLALTWDEDDSSGNNQVATILLGSSVIVGGLTGATYDHYSLLRTVEDSLGLSTLTANDANAASISDLFSAPPPPSPSPSPSPSPTPRPSPSPTPSPSPSPSPTPSPSPSPSPSPVPPGPCTGASLSSGPASSASAGASVTWTGSAAGCSSPQYRFWELDPGRRWSMVQDYSSASTYAWRSPDIAGDYEFEVDVRAAGETAAYDVVKDQPYVLRSAASCTAPTLSVFPTSPGATGVAVTMTGGSSSCPNPRYRFWVSDPGSRWSMVQDYSASNTHVWSQTYAPGIYRMEVDVRDASETTAYDAVKNITFTLNGCTGATLSAGPTTAAHGAGTITLTATATCPGTPEYRFWVEDPGNRWSMVQDFSTTNTYTWPKANQPDAGVYHIEVDVRDQGSDSVYEYATSGYTYTMS